MTKRQHLSGYDSTHLHILGTLVGPASLVVGTLFVLVPVPLLSATRAKGARLHQADLLIAVIGVVAPSWLGRVTAWRGLPLEATAAGLVAIAILRTLVGHVGHSHLLGYLVQALELVVAVPQVAVIVVGDVCREGALVSSAVGSLPWLPKPSVLDDRGFLQLPE